MNTGLLISISILLWIWVCKPLNKKLSKRKEFMKSNLFQLQQAYYHNSKLDRNKNKFPIIKFTGNIRVSPDVINYITFENVIASYIYNNKLGVIVPLHTKLIHYDIDIESLDAVNTSILVYNILLGNYTT